MFAVVDIAGKQFKVLENEKYYVPRLAEEPEKELTLDNVLMYSDGKKTQIGTPLIDKIKIKAKVLEHVRDDKVLVFKKKRRKGYQKLNGHRQDLTRIEITKIG